VDVPVTVVSGERSAPVRREAARVLTRMLARADLVQVAAGHLAQVEAPASVADAISARVAQ
jgi:pimeloyl-ACP methyl ester carboxylesterase